MDIKKFKVFTIDRFLIYGGVNLFGLGLIITALIRNYVVTSTGIPVPGLIAMTGMLACFVIPTVILFKMRQRFANTIKAYTQDGTGIVPDYIVEPNLPTLVRDVEMAELEVVNFWAGKLNKGIFTFLDYLNGGMLGFTKNRIDLLQHPPTGPMIVDQGFKRWAVGKTSGNWSCVQYSGELSDWPRAVSCIKHETAHKCLTAAGINDTRHHELMRENGFKY